jgi:hypothetical protein
VIGPAELVIILLPFLIIGAIVYFAIRAGRRRGR